MPRKLVIPPDALARQNMLKEVCKNPPKPDTTPAVDDRTSSGSPPKALDDAPLMPEREDARST